MDDTVHITGLRELQVFLDALPAKVEKNILRGALTAGAKPIKKQAMANIHSRSGELARSIRVSTRFKDGKVVASISAWKKRLASKKKGGGVLGDAYYANWVEYGTRQHLISVQESEKPINRRASAKAGKIVRASMTTVNRNVLKIGNTFVGPTVEHPGANANPFMRPALDTMATTAVIATAEYIRNRLATREGLDAAAGVEIGVEE